MVSIQRFRGRLGEREGTFVLQGSESIERGRIKATWFVVPGSGTGALHGLRGEGGFEGQLGCTHVRRNNAAHSPASLALAPRQVRDVHAPFERGTAPLLLSGRQLASLLDATDAQAVADHIGIGRIGVER